SGPDPEADSPVGITAEVPVTDSYVLSEAGPAGYGASAWECSAGTLAGNTVTLEAGDEANCTITNDDTAPPANPATITVAKLLGAPQWGGQLVAADFQLLIDGNEVSQSAPHEVSPGLHTISEVPRPGYQQTAIVCTDLTTSQQLSSDGTVTTVAGQHVECDVTNAEVPPTLTLQKFVTNDNGGNAVSSDFQLQIDGATAAQNTPVAVVAGVAHVITEVPTAGYRLVSITCTDDAAGQSVAYNAGVSLALGQHVTCRLTNDDDPVDLVITKTNDAVTQIAGGPAFAYTITVDNLGPRDASITEPVTVTDQLPNGFDFVSFPTNCTAAGQALTCDVAPADLQVVDSPVVLTVTVKVHPDAASGIYTNMAYVATADDPACVGTGCVPVCGSGSSNNIACATTTIKRQANITIDKVDNVDGPILPGTNYSYFITVGNSGPSTFLASMTMTDDLPAGLIFQSVSAAAPWTCNNSDPIACTYGAVLQPNTTAPVVTVNVQLDPAFTGTTVHNVANAFAVVEPPTAQIQALQIETPADPGTVVTATDDETTTILRNVNLSIDKSVSQATATAGDQVNWMLDITNHGPDTASNVVVSDTIPAAFEVIGTFPTAGLICTSTGNSVQCTAASLANGATVRAVVQVRVAAAAAPGAVVNTATVVTDSNDTDPSDNSDSASITVTAIASASLAPTAASPSGTSGSGVTLPRTGNASLDGSLSLAGLLFAGGIFSLAIARRRRALAAQ
ncbi:MAG TPA: LPXTG cell wall anchor domain-containing protein, partial [Ilumatobacteraceae bacterium]|nr:LPXTG cell wall anchor domain-containing protein [Ilumatobacteraceae bacterium]